jgi:hypothetical protein
MHTAEGYDSRDAATGTHDDLAADRFAQECDFLSVGTNDLAQYAFAADRHSASLAPLNDPWQPALLRMIDMVARAAAISDKPVGVCGEAASDPLLALVLAGLGVSSLSMAPRALAGVGRGLAAVLAVAAAMMWASEVLPVPAGPHRITERSSSASIRARRALWGPSTWPWPTNSSSVRGRIRAARGASWSPSRSARSENRSMVRPS